MRVFKICRRDDSVGVCRRHCRRRLPVAVVDINPCCCSDALLGFGLATHNTFAPKSPRARRMHAVSDLESVFRSED